MTWGRTTAVVAMTATATLALTGCSGAKEYVVPAESMEPGITRGETIQATTVEDYEPDRGDVVVFEDPGGWLVAGDGDGKLVKRVIGREGDVIECCSEDGWLLINGEELDESQYIAEHHGECTGSSARCHPTW